MYMYEKYPKIPERYMKKFNDTYASYIKDITKNAKACDNLVIHDVAYFAEQVGIIESLAYRDHFDGKLSQDEVNAISHFGSKMIIDVLTDVIKTIDKECGCKLT